MPKKRISDDPKKGRSGAPAGSVLSQRATKREQRSSAGHDSHRATKREQRSPAGGVLSGASAATAAGAVTVPVKAVVSGAGAATVAGSLTVTTKAVLPGAGAVSVDEAKVLHDFLRERVRLPEDMHWGEFRVGEDSTGEPAVWIVVVAHDDLSPQRVRWQVYNA
jgi:hypothetical protein